MSHAVAARVTRPEEAVYLKALRADRASKQAARWLAYHIDRIVKRIDEIVEVPDNQWARSRHQLHLK